MPQDNCPMCGHELRARTGTYETSFLDRKGQAQRLLVPNVSWSECEACKEAFLDEPATQQIEAARRKALKVLNPSEIRALRVRLKKTQKEMSQLLGIGEKTYCRWESGAYIQSTALDRYLRLLIERAENVELLEGMERADSRPSPNLERTENVFTYLRDLQPVQDLADVFTELLETGQLYSTARLVHQV